MGSLLELFGKDGKERVENAVETLRSGRGIILVDDEDRENEGDLIFAAESMTAEDMALMIRECSGIVCLCLNKEKCEELGLPLMVANNQSRYKTAFTISIEAREGVSTGVSAADRITTIRAAIAPDSKASDLVQPGHVFPLIAESDGVLSRKGHTEGSVDIVKLAGKGSFAVLCELTNPDGTMARLAELVAFAQKHNLGLVSVEDIFQYRKLFRS